MEDNEIMEVVEKFSFTKEELDKLKIAIKNFDEGKISAKDLILETIEHRANKLMRELKKINERVSS